MKLVKQLVIVMVLSIAGFAVAEPVILNGDFADGMTDWDYWGEVLTLDGIAWVSENPDDNEGEYDGYVSELYQDFTIPKEARSLSFKFSITYTPDDSSGDEYVDSLFVFLLDSNGDPILHTSDYTEFYYFELDWEDYSSEIVSVSGMVMTTGAVTLDLSSLTTDIEASLVFSLYDYADGYETHLAITDVKVTVCETEITGDLNDDCKVDLLDLAILSANWMQPK